MVRRMVWIVVLALAASAAVGGVPEDPNARRAYDLMVDGDRVSLRVSNGSVIEIIEDLGNRLGFEVVARSVADLRVSEDFEGLHPRDAIRRICSSTGYLMVPDPATGKVVRLVLMGSTGSANRLEPRRDPLPARPSPQAPRSRPRPPTRPERPENPSGESPDEDDDPKPERGDPRDPDEGKDDPSPDPNSD